MTTSYDSVIATMAEIENRYTTPGSRKRMYSHARKEFDFSTCMVIGWRRGVRRRDYVEDVRNKAANLSEFAFNILRLSPEESLQLKTDYSKTLNARKDSLVLIKNPEGYLETCETLIQSSKPFDLIVGLCGLTGRRPYEIASTASFTCVKSPLYLFRGQAKTKGLDGPSQYEIPVLTLTDILGPLKRLRTLKHEYTLMTSEEVHDRVSRSCSKVIDKHFNGFLEPDVIKLYDLRAIYATIAYKVFAPVDMHNTRYYSKILGHGEDDSSTGESYAKFYLGEEQCRSLNR